jgi:hypothetical protein
MKSIFTVFTCLIILLSSTKTLAWGKKGHHLVAEVAFRYMNDNSKQNVLMYLDGMSIADASVWMDKMKSNKSFNFMQPYHYVNFKIGETVSEPSGDNIIKQINLTLKELDNLDSLTNDEIRTSLLYLFHLIGDLHQPLHIGYKDDKGGNSVQVSFLGKGSNLHSVWDTAIIENKKLTLDECLTTKKYSVSRLKDIQKINTVNWAKESRSYLDKVYEINNNKIDDKYINASYPIIKEQILKAGIRLASVLDYYFTNIEFKASTSDVKAIEPISINISEVKAYEGKLVKVCSKVYGSKFLESSKNQPTFLNIGAEYPNSPLTVLIWGSSRINFQNKPEDYYNSKNVCITGVVVIYNSKPEIIISNESEIDIK